jgi:hypothetical protein
MNTDLVPALDPTAIPAPPWLIHFLLVFTFILHALFMNLALGGTILAAVSQLFAGRDEGGHRVALAERLMGINTYAISLAITTGIAPLLFVQLLYQQYFYTATILIGWIWLLFLVMLTLGYYAAYAYKFRGAPARGSGGTPWLVVAALMFLLIAMVHVAVNLIHSQPGSWAALAANPWSILADPAYFPRLLHFVLAAIGFTSIVAAWWAVRQAAAGKDVERNTSIARYAWKWTLWTTLVQIADGFLLLLVLPREVLLGLMRGGAATMIPLTLSILLALGLLMMLSRVSNPVEKSSAVTGTLATMLLTIVVMSVTRHQLREIYLQPATSQFELTSAPQWGNFVLFALLLVAGLATVAYMVKQVLANPASGDEAA